MEILKGFCKEQNKECQVCIGLLDASEFDKEIFIKRPICDYDNKYGCEYLNKNGRCSIEE